ncbi:unnamed protein product [Ectocarpus sp. CCAP 1310/34]|nr:unnamed protein product [Ectocarpus sp. CCAP 1310/34]
MFVRSPRFDAVRMLRCRCSGAAAPGPLWSVLARPNSTRSASYTLSLLSFPVGCSLSPSVQLGFLV